MRLFLILVVLQTIFLPTRSAFPDDLQAFSWQHKPGDAFYRGTVTLPDGTSHAFQTRDDRLWFPRRSKVKIKAYASPSRLLGARTVSRDETEVAVAPPPVVHEPPPSPSHFDKDDEADTVEYGSTDEIVGKAEGSSEATANSNDLSTSDLCNAIEARIRLYLGQENIKAKGGLSDFEGDSPIVGTLIDWACTLSEKWTWKFELGRHDLRLKQRETTTNGTSERTRSYDRTYGGLAAMRRWETTPLTYGLGLSYARLPLLKITQPTLNASQLKQQGFGMLSALGRYAPEDGPQLGFSLSPYGLGANRFLAYTLDAGWRMRSNKQWFWDLGLRYEAVSVTIDSTCRDNPACRATATTDLSMPQGWIGVGKDF